MKPWTPWNKGKLVGQKGSLELREIWTLRARLPVDGGNRKLALFDLAIDSKLRGCDLVGFRVSGVASVGTVQVRAAVGSVARRPRRPVEHPHQ